MKIYSDNSLHTSDAYITCFHSTSLWLGHVKDWHQDFVREVT